jgi:hypothetical protein
MRLMGKGIDRSDDSEFWSDYGLEEDPTSILRHDSSSSSTGSSVSSKDYVLLPPTVFAFSLALREWGDMSVEGFSEIEFRNDAWDRLVIDKDYKELIRSLVGENTKENGKFLRRGKEGEQEKGENEPLGDIVEGKGGGLVIGELSANQCTLSCRMLTDLFRESTQLSMDYPESVS